MPTPRTGGRSTAVVPLPSDEARLELVRATVAKNASDDELAMFMALADRYDLDPFAKEIACAVPVDADGNRKLDRHGQPYPPMIMTTRDGFLAIANREQAFDGMDGDVVHEKDTFGRNADGSVLHVYAQGDRGKVRGAWAMVYRKDRTIPAYFYAPWVQYGEPNLWFVKRDGSKELQKFSPWAKFPSAMILKVAESMALKRAFSLSGLTSEGEWDAADSEAVTVFPETQPAHRIRQPELGPHGVAKKQQPGRAAVLDAPAPTDADLERPDGAIGNDQDDDPDGQIGFPDHDEEAAT